MSAQQQGSSKFERIFGSIFFWVGIAASVFAFSVVRSVTAEVPDPPKPMIDLPSFTLTDQMGEPFGSADLEGKIWVANFIFTSCPTLCPQLTSTMQKVKHRLRGMGRAVHLVSFSVDPERDTPEKLLEYSARYGANPSQWSFLTGTMEAVSDAVVKGFKMPIDGPDDPEEGSVFDITHGTRFVIVDPQNRVRGYYETTPDEIDRLVRDVGLLSAAEQRAARQRVAQR